MDGTRRSNITRFENGRLQKQTSINELVELFFAGRNAQTLKAYRKDLEDFCQFLNFRTIEEAAEFLLSNGHGHANKIALSYRAHLIDSGLQATTVCRRLSSLRSLVSLARTLGIVPYKLEVKNPKVEAYRDTRGPGKTNFERMLAEAKRKKNPKAIRDRAILRLLYDMGLRASEVIALDVEHFDEERSTLKVLRKGKLQRVILMLPEVTRTALSEWTEIRRGLSLACSALFISMDRSDKGQSKRLTRNGLYDLIRAIGAKVKIKTHPHAIRHTSITEAIKEAKKIGLGLDDVLDYSGHSNITTLAIYNDREKNMQGQIASLVSSNLHEDK